MMPTIDTQTVILKWKRYVRYYYEEASKLEPCLCEREQSHTSCKSRLSARHCGRLES